MQHKKYAIYTVMVGGYDEIMQPMVVDDRFDYILFSNDIKEDRVGVWQVRPIAYTNPDNTRICRYVKTHPEELLDGYEASVWMDSNLQIITEYLYNIVVDFFSKGIYVASINHQGRNCIYDEAFAVLECGYEHEDIVLKWCYYLHRQNYPRNNGLYETNVLYRRNNDIIKRLDDLWWNCIDNFSKRDQLSFNYVLWKLNIICELILPERYDTCNSIHFRRYYHSNEKSKYNGINRSWLIKYCAKIPSSKKKIQSIYRNLFSIPINIPMACVIGHFFRVKYLFIYYIKKIKKYCVSKLYKY